MFHHKKFLIIIIAFEIVIYSNCISDNITITKINPGFTNVTWIDNTPYLYYIDIKDYYLEEENVVEFIFGYKNTTQDMSIRLLTTDRTEEEIKKGLIIPIEEDQSKFKKIKKTLTSDFYVYVNNFKKTSKDQTFFLIYIIPKKIQKNSYNLISLSNRIQNYTFTNENFENNTIAKQNLKIRRNVEDFYKFIFKDISVKEQNIVIFLKEYNIICFYKDEINIIGFQSNRMFLIEKNSTNKTNHVIFLSGMGEVGEIDVEIALIKNDIIFLKERIDVPFYLENLKYGEDIYIVENYGKLNTYNSTIYNLSVIPFYGDYTLTLYSSYNTIDLEDLFNNTNGTIIDKSINAVSGTSNFYRLSCASPCALKFGYIHHKLDNSDLKEGDFLIRYVKTQNFEEEKYNLILKDVTKVYYLFYELYGNVSDYNNKPTNYAIANYINLYFGYDSYEALYHNKKNHSREIYYSPNYKYLPEIRFHSMTGFFIKFYLTSNSLYYNIIEGLNVIDLSKKNLAFKMRRDILYDYVLINIYSHDKEHYTVGLFYDVKIISPEKIDIKGRVLCELPTKGQIRSKEIKLKYSNPYNKYNSKIKDDELVVIVFNFPLKEVIGFPIIFEVKYFYNDSIVNIPYKEATIIELNKEYKIYSEKEYATNSYIIFNMNKCNLNKNYSINTFYESLNNIIWKNELIEKRSIILHNNIYNNSCIKLEEIIQNNTNDSIINNDKLKINSIFPPTNYLTNDDIYMNYFTINESLLNFDKITNDFSIKYENNKDIIYIKWLPYISKDSDLPELAIQYNLYIFPENSKVNSICQMSLIPPNYTVINKTEYDFSLPKGKYRINIIASVLNNEFPLITFYDELYIKVSQSIKNIIYIVMSVSIVFLFMFLFSLYIMNKYKKNERRSISRNTFWISLVEQRESVMNRKNKNKKNNFILFDWDDEDDICKDD